MKEDNETLKRTKQQPLTDVMVLWTFFHYALFCIWIISAEMILLSVFIADCRVGCWRLICSNKVHGFVTTEQGLKSSSREDTATNNAGATCNVSLVFCLWRKLMCFIVVLHVLNTYLNLINALSLRCFINCLVMFWHTHWTVSCQLHFTH